jgi:diguanylate cyclase (GGDEF)-like protein
MRAVSTLRGASSARADGTIGAMRADPSGVETVASQATPASTAVHAHPGPLGRLVARLVGAHIPATREDALGERLATLLGISQRLTRTLDRREILQTIADEANRVLGSDGTTIRMLEGGVLRAAAWSGFPDEVAARLPTFRADEGWFGQICTTGRPLVAGDIPRDGLPGIDRYDADMTFGSTLMVPLIHGSKVIGALSSACLQPRTWTHDDIEFITALATDASIAINNAELYERSQNRAAQFAVLQAASARMNRAKTIESVGQAIVQETRRVLDYHNARVYVLEPPDALVPIAFEGIVGEYEKVDFDLLRTTLGVGFTGWVGQHGTPLLVPDANADPRGSTIPGTDDVDESMLVVPMHYDEVVVGVITLSKLGLDQFTEDDLQLLMILADQAATALESARLLAHSQDVARELSRLVEMSSALSASLDPRQVANLIAQHVAQALNFDECAISYWDRPGARVATLGYYPVTDLRELQAYFEISGYPETRRVLETQATVVVDADDPEADPAEVELMSRQGHRLLVMLPLVAKGQAIGLVELLSKHRVVLEESRLELARTMANEAAIALENARLYEDARNLADRDPLTGFYNHRYLHERLGEEVVRAQRSRQPLSVLMIDLDDFKLVNDTFGHLFGDRLLVWIAERIRSTLRLSDVPARYGGDEFAIILPDADINSARRAAERILQTFETEGFEADGRGPVPVSMSIGAASHPADGRTATDLIAAADRGLYRVKRKGGRRVDTAGPVLAEAGEDTSAA